MRPADMDLATLANAPRHLDVGGSFHLVSALTLRDWGHFQGWIKDFVPRPEAPEGSDAIDRAAYRDAWPPAIASREWFAALDHPGAFPEFVRRALGKHAPVPMEDVEALVLAARIVEAGKVADLVLFGLGGDPADHLASGATPEPEPVFRLPEGDAPGDSLYTLAKVLHWSHERILDLTFKQLHYYLSAGKPLKAGRKRFSSTAAARASRNGDGNSGEAA